MYQADTKTVMLRGFFCLFVLAVIYTLHVICIGRFLLHFEFTPGKISITTSYYNKNIYFSSKILRNKSGYGKYFIPIAIIKYWVHINLLVIIGLWLLLLNCNDIHPFNQKSISKCQFQSDIKPNKHWIKWSSVKLKFNLNIY